MNTQTIIEGVTPPQAPKRTDAMVKAAVLDYINENFLQWGNGDADQAARDVALVYRDGMDGYELAKQLENECRWDGVCFGVAEDLDSISSVVRDAEEVARAAWADEWAIAPMLAIGTRIKQGVITGVYEHGAACYLVKKNGCTEPGRHSIVKFEDAQEFAA